MLFNSWWKLGSGPKVKFFCRYINLYNVLFTKKEIFLKGFQEFERWLIFYPPPPFILGKYLGKWRFRIKPISRSIIITNHQSTPQFAAQLSYASLVIVLQSFFFFFYFFSLLRPDRAHVPSAFSFSLVCRTGQHSMRGVLHSFRSVPFPLNSPILYHILLHPVWGLFRVDYLGNCFFLFLLLLKHHSRLVIISLLPPLLDQRNNPCNPRSDTAAKWKS